MKDAFTCYIIDDDIDDLEIFEMALNKVDENIKLRSAYDCVEGLEELKVDDTFVPDYIFLDINMPKMNGLQCLPELKKLDHLKDAKIIMYSTSSDDDVKRATKRLGADDFLVKPPTVSGLVFGLSQILKRGE